MTKQQFNFRASDLTRQQLDWLRARWGTSLTETITVAIDRIYRAEQANTTDPAPAICPVCGAELPA